MMPFAIPIEDTAIMLYVYWIFLFLSVGFLFMGVIMLKESEDRKTAWTLTILGLFNIGTSIYNIMTW